MNRRRKNPGPLGTAVIASAVGGAAMQAGSVLTSSLIEWAGPERFGRRRRANPQQQLSRVQIFELKMKLLQ